MLEDDFTYVLRKALTGHGLAPSEAAVRAGLQETAVLSFLHGSFNEEIARKLAPVLGLNAEAFVTHVDYAPATVSLEGIHRLDLSFGKDRVNAWLLEKENAALLFDLGNEPDEVFEKLSELGKHPTQIFITHGHHDPIGALERAQSSGIPLSGAEQLAPGKVISCGPLTVHVVNLDGHFLPAFGFLIEGFSVPVFVAGDAVFAGSIGGCPDPSRFRLALANIHAALDFLPEETVILPGHGPATTLGEERKRNPFF